MTFRPARPSRVYAVEVLGGADHSRMLAAIGRREVHRHAARRRTAPGQSTRPRVSDLQASQPDFAVCTIRCTYRTDLTAGVWSRSDDVYPELLR